MGGHTFEDGTPNLVDDQRYVHKNKSLAQCLKITEKVSFNIASEASYDYILNLDPNPNIWVQEIPRVAFSQCWVPIQISQQWLQSEHHDKKSIAVKK